MPDTTAPDATAEEHEVEIDFDTYGSGRMAMLSVPLGIPTTSTVLVRATMSEDGEMGLEIHSDVSEDPEQAVTYTIGYLEQVVQLLRDADFETLWAQQFVERPAKDAPTPEEGAL